MFKHLHGTDISDRSKYGLVLDVGEMSCEKAALVAVMNTESVNLHEEEEEMARLTV